MTRAYDEEAMKPLGPRLEPPPPRWRKWMALAVLLAAAAVLPVLKWLFGASGGP